ncbi:MAG: tetratricopeptide repeat protein [Phycisphaerae bacterium]
MSIKNRTGTAVCALLSLSSLVGCAPERAVVAFSYVVEPTKGLPPGMKTIIIEPANTGLTTDAKWSEMCTSVLHALVDESRGSFGTDIQVVNRRDAGKVFEREDLAAAGMSTRRGGAGGQLLDAQGAILSNINVKVEKYIGKQRTLSGLWVSGGGGRRRGHGSTDIRTEEIETITRNITAQTEFTLMDLGNGRVWEHYLPKTYRATERTQASPIFGSSQTEAELTPQDQIVATLVERGAREFISRLMPCRISVEAEVVSSTNANCVRGVKMLRAEAFGDAFAFFKEAWSRNPDDDRAAYGAGVAAEASGRYREALEFYKRACAALDSRVYADARDRMKEYAGRIRR